MIKKVINIFGFLILISVLFSQNMRESLINNLKNKYPTYSKDEISNFINKEVLRSLDDDKVEKLFFKKTVYDKIQSQINKTRDSKIKAELYFRLAQLSSELDIGNYKKIANYYRNVLKYDDSFEYKDIVLYNLGYYSLMAVKNDLSSQRISFFENQTNPVTKFPDNMLFTKDKVQEVIDTYNSIPEDSELYGEALYRLGMLYFELSIDAPDSKTKQNYIDTATRLFTNLASSDDPNFEVLAKFQSGWTAFAKNEYEKAMQQFIEILDVTSGNEEIAAQLEYDALRVLTFSMIEQFDGSDYLKKSEAAEFMVNTLSKELPQKYIQRIFDNAVEFKTNYNAPSQVIDFYDAMVRLYPTNINAPSLIDSIIVLSSRHAFDIRENYDVSATDDKTMQENVRKIWVNQYERLRKNYNAESEWYNLHKAEDISSQLSLIKKSFEFLYPSYRNPLAKSVNGATISQQQIDKFEELATQYLKFEEFKNLESIITEQDIYLMLAYSSLALAEQEENVENMMKAVERVNYFVQKYPDFPENEILTGNQYVVVKNIFDLKNEEIANLEDKTATNPFDSLFVVISKNYEKVLEQTLSNKPENEQLLINIIYDRANNFYNTNRYDLAYNDYEKLLTLNIDNTIRSDVYGILAYINYEKKDFAKAKEFYVKQAELAENAEIKKLAENNIKNAIISQANAYKEAGDYMSAAQTFLSLNSEEGTLQAAKIYYENKDYNLAAETYLLIGNDEAKSNAAYAYQEAKEFQKSIDIWNEMARKSSNYEDKHKYYEFAWTLTDSLNDINQKINIKKEFINVNDKTDVAYLQQISIISMYENGKVPEYRGDEGKLKAAQMYLDLYNLLERRRVKVINAANGIALDRERFYFMAATIYEELGQETKTEELMTAFNRKYPENNYAKKYIRTTLTLKYKKSGDDEKYEKLIEKIFLESRTDTIFTLDNEGNTIGRTAENELTVIAKSKAQVIYQEVMDAFNAKKRGETSKKVAEFKRLVSEYNRKGLNLQFDSLIEQFDFFKTYFRFVDNFYSGIASIEEVIKTQKIAKQFRVNRNTTWKRHIVGGDNRIKKVVTNTNREAEKIMNLIKSRNKILAKANELGLVIDDLKQSDVTKLLYLGGKLYEDAGNTIVSKVEEYIRVANDPGQKLKQYRAYAKKSPENAKKVELFFKKQFLSVAYKEKNKLLFNKENQMQSAYGYYGQNVALFNKDYLDEWVYKTWVRLKEIGFPIAKFDDFELISNAEWKTNNRELTDFNNDVNDELAWGDLYISQNTSNKIFNDSQYAILLTEFDTYVKAPKIIGAVEMMMIQYEYEKTGEILLNGSRIESLPQIQDSTYNGNIYVVYLTKNQFNSLENNLIFKIKNSGDVIEQKNFIAKISYMTNPAREAEFIPLENIYSDETWLTFNGKTDELSAPDSLWINAAVISDSVFLGLYNLNFETTPNLITNTNATQTDTISFAKNIELPRDIQNAILRVAGSNVTVIVNSELIAKDVNSDINNETNKKNIIEITIPQLYKGENSIIIKSSDNTIGFELDLTQ